MALDGVREAKGVVQRHSRVTAIHFSMSAAAPSMVVDDSNEIQHFTTNRCFSQSNEHDLPLRRRHADYPLCLPNGYYVRDVVQEEAELS